MAEKGGSSTATDVDFEAWVAAIFLSEVVLGGADSVKLQAKIVKDLGGKEDKPFIDDITVFRKRHIEFYDCKYRVPRAGQWTYANLKEHRILDRLRNQYLVKPAYKLFFATESPCPLIAEGFQRSANSDTVFEAVKRLQEGKYIDDWKRTKEYLQFSDEEMIKFTRRIKLFQLTLTN